MSPSSQNGSWFRALDTSPLPTLVLGHDVQVLFANEAARRDFRGLGEEALHSDQRAGVLLGCIEAEGEGGCGQQVACSRCVVRHAVEAALAGEEIRREVARLAVRDGAGSPAERRLRVSATAVTRAVLGRVVMVLEPEEGLDAPLRRELETARAILDAAPVPVFVKGPGGQFVYVNQEGARVLGREPAEVVGRTDADFFTPGQVAALRDEDDRVLQGADFESEQTFDGLPGGPRSVLVRKRRGTGSGGEPLVLATGADISELRRAQLALEESQRRVEDGLATLRGVLEATDSAIFSVDRLYRYTSFNGAHAATMRAIYGTELEVGYPISECFTVAEDWTAAKVNLDRVLAGEGFVVEAYSGDLLRTRRYFEINHAPIRAVDGVVIGAAVFARDVTKRRQAEQALRESEEHLRQSQKMEAVGQLAGGVAHDFNNLLTVILASADFGLAELPAGHSIREEFEEVRAAGRRAQALTRQLLAFSRRQVLKPQVLDLNARVREVEGLLGRLLGEDVVVRTRFDPRLPPVFIDPGQLEQVLLNLAVNGRDAMPGGGTLTIETANVTLAESYVAGHVGATAGPQVMLAISDTGCGMDAATRERIFEPFFTTKPKGKGTGLGLPTVYGIVKQSGGSIWVYSELGHGTTVKIYLPRAPRQEEELPAPVPALRLQARPGESVLVVEDDAQVRRSAVRCLERLGYAVSAADGLAEATAILDDGARFTALVTDVVMAGGSGVEVARMARARLPGLRVVFMSGYTDDAIAQHGVLSPGALFLEKPFTPESLGRKIREAVDQAVAAR